MSNKIDDHIEEYYPDDEILRCDGFDDCVLGIVTGFGKGPKLCYDREAMIEQLVDESDMDREDAEEHFEFNIAGAYVGEGTPVFLSKIPGIDLTRVG